jgi:hypothetical protein
MKVTITSIELKGPLKFFALSLKAMNIMKQLKSTDYVAMKKQGLWTKHYTMTLWNNEEDMKNFARSGAHQTAMKESAEIAKEIRSVTIDATEFPDWKTAKVLLESAKPMRF